jgi:hypothetical protein
MPACCAILRHSRVAYFVPLALHADPLDIMIVVGGSWRRAMIIVVTFQAEARLRSASDREP